MDVWSILERAEESWPTREGLVDGKDRRTYGELAARARSVASALRAHGVGRGDRVAILDRNSTAFFEAYFATAGLGAILVPLNVRLAPREVAEILTDAEPVAWLLSGEHAELASAAPASTELVVWLGKETSLAIPTACYEDIARATDGFEAEVCDEDRVAQLYYTSGTTGVPKGVMLTHENVCEHALAATSELDLAEDDTWGHFAPMFHLADAWATFALTLVGGRHVIAPSFDGPAALELMQREGVTITNLVPTMLRRLLDAAKERGARPDQLRTMLSGGAPIAPETVRRVLDVLGCEYVQTYGMTETSPYLTLSCLQQHHYELPPEEQLRIRSRTGRPFETVELEVVDESGTPVPRDDRAVGEIRVRGATVSPGYWRRPEETEAAIRDGWLYTGDLAVIDREGYVNIVDRKKDMIITGGENVFSIEVENVLYEHPAVAEAAVFGVPHPEWGEEVRAAVALSADVGVEELSAFCRERLASFKCPGAIDVLEELPKTGSGKIRKSALREA